MTDRMISLFQFLVLWGLIMYYWITTLNRMDKLRKRIKQLEELNNKP